MLKSVAVGVLILFLFLGAFASPIASGIKTWRTQEVSQIALVTTGGGETTYTANLTDDLFQESISEVQVIATTLAGETPVASSYTSEPSKGLLISGLTESQTRTLTIHYYAESDDQTMRIIGPFLVFLIFGGIVAAIIYGIFKNR